MYLSPRKKLFVETASKMFGVNSTISKQNVREAAAEAGVPFPSWFIKGFKAHYGHFTLPLFEGAVAPASAVSAPASPSSAPLLPSQAPLLPFAHHGRCARGPHCA